VERLNRAKTVYDATMENYADANLFDDHELNSSKSSAVVAGAIVQSLLTVQPAYKIIVDNEPKPETYLITASQDDNGILSINGRRQCIIVCGQTTDTNTEILFKVLEYKAKHNVSMPGLLAFRDDESFTPIDKSKIADMNDKLLAQLQSGVSNLTVRIQGAIGQTPAPTVQPAVPQ
jgi:hypothetical protein